MSSAPKLTHYVSEIDEFIHAFNKKNPGPSVSQKKEQDKHNLIYHWRDGKDRVLLSKQLEEDF